MKCTKRTLSILLALCLLLGLLPAAALAAEEEAGQTGVSTAAELAAAVAAGGTVKIADNTTITLTADILAPPAGVETTILGGENSVIKNDHIQTMFQVPEGATLTLQNVTLDGGGAYDEGTDAWSGNQEPNMILVFDGGKLVLREGAVLQNHRCADLATNADSFVGGAAVGVRSGAVLEMYAGSVIQNAYNSQLSYGAGVSNMGTFTMYGGTITNCTVTTQGGWGGAVHNSGTFVMEDGTISDSAATMYGGGVANGGGVFTMHGGTISGNKTTGDGSNSITGGGGVYTSGSFTMDGGAISGNAQTNEVPLGNGTTTGYYYSGGGGVYVAGGGTFAMSGSAVISGNRTEDDYRYNNGGGGVYVYSGGVFTMDGGEISGNECAEATYTTGGGVFVYGGTATLSNGAIKENETKYSGAGLYINSGSLTLTDMTVSGNAAGSHGGGIHTQGGTTVITGGELSGNTCASYGGGIFQQAGAVKLDGGTITGNASTKGWGGWITYGGTNEIAGDLQVFGNQTVDLIVSKELTVETLGDGARLNVYPNTKPTAGSPTLIAQAAGSKALMADDLARFTCQRSDCMLALLEGRIYAYLSTEYSKPTLTAQLSGVTSEGAGIDWSVTRGTNNYTCTVYYRKTGETEWTRYGDAQGYTDSVTDQNSTLTGLTPETDYEALFRVEDTQGARVEQSFSFRTAAAGAGGSISVKVTGTNDTKVTVSIREGETWLATGSGTIANESFSTSFSGLSDGVYSLICASGDFLETRSVTIEDGSAVTAEFSVPTTNGVTSTEVTYVGEDAPPAAVAGLAELVTKDDQSKNGSGIDITYTIEVTLKDEDEADGSQTAITGAASGQTVDTFLDLSLYKKTGTEAAENIGASNTTVLEIAIPFDTGRPGLVVYRYHSGAAEALSALSSRKAENYKDGDYYVGDGYIFIYASKFSTYAIAYTETYEVTVETDGHGTAAASLNSAAEGTEITLSVSPNSGYRFQEWQVVSGNITVSGNKFTMPAGNVVVKAIFEHVGGGSSGSSATYYTVTASAGAGGSIDPGGKVSVRKNGNQTFTVTPDEGHVIADVLVDGVSVGAVSEYTFEKVTKAHTIAATFQKPDAVADCPKDETCPIAAFDDADPTAWYHDSVHYCVENGLMIGTDQTTFEPDRSTSRATIATILWRLEGSPAVNYALRYDDVAEGVWYTEAIRWATSEGVVEGYGNGKFGPNDPITREQLAVMLWRYAGSPAVEVTMGMAGYDDVADISGWAADAMRWAVTRIGVITGKENGILDPQGEATRAEAATMLMRYCYALK